MDGNDIHYFLERFAFSRFVYGGIVVAAKSLLKNPSVPDPEYFDDG